jgi:alpha,alpha-trehalase
MQGLIQSQLFDVANDTLQNFMDEIERFGFIPNGGRTYCTTLPTLSLRTKY